MEYETIAIFKLDCAPDYIEEVSKKVEKATGKKPSAFKAKNDWGSKTFAYEIEKQKQGRYISWTFGGSSQAPSEVDKVLRFEEDILRYVTFRTDNMGRVEVEQNEERDESKRTQIKVDFRNPLSLAKFITEKGKIIPRRVTGVSTQTQNLITREIKRARELSLLSYTHGISTRSPEEDSRGDRRGGGGRRSPSSYDRRPSFSKSNENNGEEA